MAPRPAHKLSPSTETRTNHAQPRRSLRCGESTFDAPFGPSTATEVWRINDQGIITGFYADSSRTPYGFEVTVGP